MITTTAKTFLKSDVKTVAHALSVEQLLDSSEAIDRLNPAQMEILQELRKFPQDWTDFLLGL